MIKEAIVKIVDKQDLTYDEAYAVISEIMSGETTPTQNAAFLAALSTKSTKAETIEEITGCAAAMRDKATKVEHNLDVTEIVGTGGDGAHSFNISTTTAIVCAAAGMKIAKHGNRAASSACGTADCLEALGVNINLEPEKCVELLEKGYGVVVVDNLVNSSAKSLERVQQITGRELSFYETDVRDRAALDRIFEKHDIGCVIHFAGLKAVGESVAMPLEYYDNNLNSTIQLCLSMREHGVKDIVFSSSATVYSGDNEMPLREVSKTGMCTNPYGWTKYMSEQILRDTVTALEGWSISLLRYFNPIGAHPSGLIGEDPRGIPNNLMPYIAQVAVGRRDHLSVFGNDYDTHDGTGVRDYIHVVDLARGHVCAIEYMQKHRGEHIFNLGTGKGYSVLDMVKAFERATGVKIPYEIVARRPGDLATVYSSPDKSAEILGWRTQYDLEDMCRDTWKWQSNNPMGYGDNKE